MSGSTRVLLTSLFAALLLALIPTSTQAQQPGDALQLFSYEVTDGVRPDIDGDITAPGDSADWKASYVRQMTIEADDGTTQKFTFLAGNDGDTLYVAGSLTLSNNSENNRIYFYFDEENNGTLDGSSSDPGEYFATVDASGNPADDGYWNGSEWVNNQTILAIGEGKRKGSGGTSRYNFELKVPLNEPDDSDNSYLNVSPGDEIGIFPRVVDDPKTKVYYWDKTNADSSDASGWGDLQTTGAGVAGRDLAALAGKDITPTIDGNISGDDNWRYSFERDIVLTNLNGSTFDANLQLKEITSSGDLVFGVTVDGFSPSGSDSLSVYTDQGEGGDR